MKRRATSGFTLIELLICCSLLLILAAFGYNMLTDMNTAAGRLADRSEALESAGRGLRLWREDVTLSRRVEAIDGGASMRIERIGEDGGSMRIVYRLADGGLIRDVEDGGAGGSSTQGLGRSVGDPRFVPMGGGWKATWTVGSDDGLHVWRQEVGALATPLRAAGRSREEARP
jgi:prepilin-type N-terminal cleavage/methylation domain-containing protein